MARRQWLFLPFGAAFGKDDKGKHGERHGRKAKGGDGGVDQVGKEERKADFAGKSEEDTVEDLNAPIHWWVICTLFPLIAGTFGPMASAFNICAVAIDWRIIVSETSDESEGTHITDPTWLVGVNAVSLAIAIIANVALLAQMTGRLRFAIGSPITIIGWYISGLIDIGLVAAAPTKLPLPPDESATWSQAYYYACIAGALYVLLSIMLSVTACGIWVFHFTSEFKLSMSQRSLMLQTMMLLGYLLVSGAVYSYIEGWDYLDAVYWANVTIFTIGFGEFTPKTHLGRSLFFPFAIGGILFVGLIIADIRSLVLESGSRKITTRVVERARFKALSKGDPKNGLIKLRGVQTRRIEGSTELERRAQEFQIMRDVLSSAAHDNRIITLVVSASSFFLLWLIGAVVFWQAEQATGGENWTYFEALYFTYVSLLTIGYGDFYPQTNSAKPAFVFWSLIALPTLTVLIGSVGDAVSDSVNALISLISRHALKLTKAVKILRERRIAHKKEGLAAIQEVEKPENSFERGATTEAGRAIDDHLASKSDETTSELKDRVVGEDAEYAYRPYMVIREIKKLVQHLDDDSSRQYSFAEWAKFLELLDEDEANPDGHRVPGHPEHQELEAVAPPRMGNKRQAWSWMGQESPLMSSDDEPKWLLTRLIEVLERELKDRGDRHVLEKVTRDTRDTKDEITLREPSV